MLKFIFYFSFVFSQATNPYRTSSAIYTSGSITVFDQYDTDYTNKPTITTYKLKDGPISDIKSNSTRISIKTDITDMLLLPLPQSKSTQTWLMPSNEEETMKNSPLRDDEWTYRWTGSDIISDNSLIAKSVDPNFPRGGFSVTIADVNNGLYMYVLGGYLYSADLQDGAISNMFYQYDFNFGKWYDLSVLTNNILPPMAYHKTFQVGNSLIVIPGVEPNAKTSNAPQYKTYKYCNMTENIDKIYVFDLKSNTWSIKNVDINMSSSDFSSKILVSRSMSIYKGKILVYALVHTGNGQDLKPIIGLLDLEKLKWSWNSNIGNLETYKNYILYYPISIVINDLLFLVNGADNNKRYNQIIVLDLNNNSFIPTITGIDLVFNDLTVLYKQALPTYAIVIIALAALVLIFLLSWLYYIKRFKSRYVKETEEIMEAVWASADMEQDTQCSKNRGSRRNKNTSSAFDTNNKPHSNEDTSTTLNETNIMNLPYFQHEVDVEDMSPVNATDQDKTS